MKEFIKGDIVSIKPEWLNEGETGDETYLIIDSNKNRVLLQMIGDKSYFVPTSSATPNMLVYLSHVDENKTVNR